MTIISFQTTITCIMAAAAELEMDGGSGNWFCECKLRRFESILGRSDLLGAVGEALAASSEGVTLTPALLSSREASSASKGDGMGRTGRS